ncbi:MULTISPECIES: ubiquinol-cytochrome c reductase iron-sulfur subunit [Vibrio]|uniref:Ubiquinol-cytochrome c reductase iron-sulfur subunit n=2 Tax=Vibrio TaxID=662 RepID=A0A7X4LH37_9VIBR|nr:MULTISPECIES: ubiquinol-cytochrome c reductase iron-sulfur subunit [Vibrio]MBF9001512.1 ubiquinol-cytochrome c reductase iron-sulfur subunit [Vibrio nitrifigilis]MZI91814.1 ubiquinol-cytochrome c reductase iron-sulfur subunit [Vibrio eleionomae]
MSNPEHSMTRRRFLTVTTAVVGGVGIATATIPFIRAWRPSYQAEVAAAPVEVDVSKLAPGQLVTVRWQGKPVWIVRRTQTILQALKNQTDQLLDPNSQEPQQPRYIQSPFRSIRPDIFVSVGVCTHLGCSPNYLPHSLTSHIEGVKAGFFCPCHGSSFDMAGRVFSGGPAPLNLLIPKHMYINDNKLLIGKDEQGSES